MELDVCPLPFIESAAALIDGNIGELTRFHETFRIYAHAVGPEFRGVGGKRRRTVTRVCWVTFVNSLTMLVARRLASSHLLGLSRLSSRSQCWR